MPHAPKARLEIDEYRKLVPDAAGGIGALSKAAVKQGFDPALIELIKIRASQLNGCAYCTQYHILEAQKFGLAADKINLVVAWREAPNFSDRERAALAWTEALTILTHGVSDEVYDEARAAFSETELAHLSASILAINAWNRLGVAYRFTPPQSPT
jgi:AhpD family alkylhydroperoxidase